MKQFNKNTLIMLSHKYRLDLLTNNRPQIVYEEGKLQVNRTGHAQLSKYRDDKAYTELSALSNMFIRRFQKHVKPWGRKWTTPEEHTFTLTHGLYIPQERTFSLRFKPENVKKVLVAKLKGVNIL